MGYLLSLSVIIRLIVQGRYLQPEFVNGKSPVYPGGEAISQGSTARKSQSWFWLFSFQNPYAIHNTKYIHKYESKWYYEVKVEVVQKNKTQPRGIAEYKIHTMTSYILDKYEL